MTSERPEERFLTLHEIVVAARANLAPGPWGYLVGGTETETTVRRNRLALDSIALRPRVLRDVSAVDATATFLGGKVRLPVMLAPVGGMESFDPDGAAAAARAAARFGIPQMLSSVCQPGLEATAAAAPDALRVFQLYVRGDDAWVEDWAQRARAHGFRAFCFTVDSAYYSRRERDLIGRFVKPWRASADAGRQFQAALSWDQVKRFKDRHHDLPIVLKGIATAEDAEVAVRHGIEVIYVSNHGGRQLDHGLGSAAVLPEVVAAVGGRAEVWVDGGFMRGSDVVKAIALGARCVGLGRLACLGLAAAGVDGLVRALELLEEEVRVCLGLLGVTSFAELTPAHVAPAPPVSSPSTLSAFPLLGENLRPGLPD
jgi:glycolate oxidase